MTAYKVPVSGGSIESKHVVEARKRERQAVLRKAYQVRKANWERYVRNITRARYAK